MRKPAVMLAFAFALNGCSQKPYGPAPEVGVEAFLTGGPADGLKSLGELKGNVVFLDFWATWCGPCVESIPHINKLVDRFKDRPVRFISVTSEDADTVRQFLATHPMKAAIALDPENRLFRAFNVWGIPRAILIDRYGTMRHVTDPRFLSAGDIEDALGAKPPAS